MILKNRLKKLILIVTLMLTVLVSLPMDTVKASETSSGTASGTVSDQKGDVTLYYPLAGVNFTLYKIGEVVSGGYYFYPPFDEMINNNSKDAAYTMQLYLTSGDGKDIKPLLTAKTGEDGIVKFTNLPKAVYLLIGEQAENETEIYTPSPSLFAVPTTIDGKISWNVEIKDKYSHKPKPAEEFVEIKVQKVWKSDAEADRPSKVTVQLLCDGKEVTDMEDGKVELTAEINWAYTWPKLSADHEWSVKEVEVPSGYLVSISKEKTTITVVNTAKNPEKEDTPGGKLPQTGQLWWPVMILICAGLFFILIGLLVARRE